MSKRITQDMAYRQSLMKYAEKYGVGRARSLPAKKDSKKAAKQNESKCSKVLRSGGL